MPVKILVAEDSQTMRKILEMTFAGEDAELIAIDSGPAALQKAKEWQPDVLLADATMPSMDGYDLAREVRGAGLSCAILLMASQHGPYDAERGKSCGVDDTVSKPFDTTALITKVSEVLKGPRATATAAPQGAPAAAAPAAAAPAPKVPPPPPARPAPAARQMAPTVPGGVPKTTMTMGSGNVQRPAPKAAPAPKPVSAAPVARAASAATNGASDMAAKLKDMGLSQEQVDGVLQLSREVVEQVVWEVVPDLAETLIREEIRRLTAE